MLVENMNFKMQIAFIEYMCYVLVCSFNLILPITPKSMYYYPDLKDEEMSSEKLSRLLGVIY